MAEAHPLQPVDIVSPAERDSAAVASRGEKTETHDKEDAVNLFKSIGDRLLGFFLPDIKAGACVPEHGEVCAVLRIDCHGQCR